MGLGDGDGVGLELIVGDGEGVGVVADTALTDNLASLTAKADQEKIRSPEATLLILIIKPVVFRLVTI